MIKKLKYEYDTQNPDDLIDILDIENSRELQQFNLVMNTYDETSYYLFKLIVRTPHNYISVSPEQFGFNYISDLIYRNFDPYTSNYYTEPDKPKECNICGMIHYRNMTKENYEDMHNRYKLCSYDQIVKRINNCYFSF